MAACPAHVAPLDSPLPHSFTLFPTPRGCLFRSAAGVANACRIIFGRLLCVLCLSPSPRHPYPSIYPMQLLSAALRDRLLPPESPLYPRSPIPF